MNFALFIDYANLFHNIQNIYGINDRNQIEDKICDSINALENYLKTHKKNKTINIVGKIAYILPDKVYGNPSEKLMKRTNTHAVIVKEDRKTKTKEMKQTQASRNDDKELARGIIQIIQDDMVNGVIVISNDNDFSNVAQQVQYIGKYYWCAAMDAKCKDKKKRVICGKNIKNVSDKWIPLYDILQNNDEGEAIDEIENIPQEDEIISGPRLEIFKDKKLVVSYPINKRNISIGRRSLRRNHIPNIDLTEFDKEKIVSREHANIYKVGEKLIFVISPKCSRYTWYKTLPKMAGTQFTLEADLPVVIGDRDGFVMFYKKD